MMSALITVVFVGIAVFSLGVLSSAWRIYGRCFIVLSQQLRDVECGIEVRFAHLAAGRLATVHALPVMAPVARHQVRKEDEPMLAAA